MTDDRQKSQGSNVLIRWIYSGTPPYGHLGNTANFFDPLVTILLGRARQRRLSIVWKPGSRRNTIVQFRMIKFILSSQGKEIKKYKNKRSTKQYKKETNY